MYCEDCGSTVPLSIAEYVDRKEKLGVVLCHGCRNGNAPTEHHTVSMPLP